MAVVPKHVAIVGGGIAGLTTAYSIQRNHTTTDLPLTCTVIEAAREWGGKIATHHAGGFVMEAGPDSFLSSKPWAIDLCRQLGLSGHLINTQPLQEKAFVFSRGHLRPLPDGLALMVPTKIGPLLRSRIVSWPGVIRMAMDLVLAAKREINDDESLASFFRRRLGSEAFDRLIEPLLAGIYAGDAEHLSLRATFPRFLDIERRHGSLIRGMLFGEKSVQSPDVNDADGRTTFVTLRNGLHTIIDALVSSLEKADTSLLHARQVTALRMSPAKTGASYELLLDDGHVVHADAVVLATPAFVSGDLIRGLSPVAADGLGAIPHASTATISLAYDHADLGPGVKGFGFVVPRIERRDLLAATWTSLKWSHRAPPSRHLARCYVGGVRREGILRLNDGDVIRRVRAELKEIAGVTAEPVYAEVNRWERGMPQYTIGHLERLAKIRAAMQPFHGVFLAGASYRGIGIPDCIRDGMETAEHVTRALFERSV